MVNYCISYDDDTCNRSNVALVGGKNASLGELAAADVRIPPGFAVTTSFYEQFLSERGIETTIQQELKGAESTDFDEIERVSRRIQDEIQKAEFPADLEAELSGAWADLVEEFDGEDTPLAVRSSATSEDQADASFAGQLDTYLNVRGFDSFTDRLRDCLSGLFTPRALSYRHERGIDDLDVSMSVGVQRLVRPRAAGVMFTLNPTNGDRSKVYIEAALGLGEAVVSGEVTPDTYLVDKPVNTLADRDLATQETKIVPTKQGTETVEVPPDRQDDSTLTTDEVATLADLGKQIERHYGSPQDIEWVVSAETGDIFVLQSRPETTWSN